MSSNDENAQRLDVESPSTDTHESERKEANKKEEPAKSENNVSEQRLQKLKRPKVLYIPDEANLEKMILSTGIRVGTPVKTKFMTPFIVRANPEGLYILDISKTLAQDRRRHKIHRPR